MRTIIQKMEGFQKWKALLVLVMLMCFGAGQAQEENTRWLRTITTKVTGQGSISYKYGLISGTISGGESKDLLPVTELKLNVGDPGNYYHFSKWTSSFNSFNNSTSTSISISGDSGDGWITANFVKNQYGINLTANPDGSISMALPQLSARPYLYLCIHHFN